ncbi:MAG: dethiobiotin synthase [Oscillospiraceae bacterium]|nr:dethiobiotin synthase [Oscillospiraceae bacterium]
MSRGLFITGTGTDVGKTYVTALIVRRLYEAGFHAAYFKAAVSGNDRDTNGNLIPGDAQWVRQISGSQQPLETMCPYIYETAVSPHLASRLEGNPVSLERVRMCYEQVCASHDYVTVEGSGGIVCPIRYDSQHILLEDIVKALQLPCLIVADAGLGTINHVVLTAEYLKSRNIQVQGIILNHFHPRDSMEEDNRFMCTELTGIPVLACVEDGAEALNIDADFLASLYKEGESV